VPQAPEALAAYVRHAIERMDTHGLDDFVDGNVTFPDPPRVTTKGDEVTAERRT
jgi:hypothetical protein